MNAKTVYLASGFNRRHHLRVLAGKLDDKGYRVSSQWIWINDRPTEDDVDYNQFARKISTQNYLDLCSSDILVIDSAGILPDNKGGVHTELGFFLGVRKPIFLVGKRGNTFHYLPQITLVEDYDELMRKL